MSPRVPVLIAAVVASVICVSGCNPEHCTGHYEPRPTTTMAYRVDSKGHLKPAGYRPGIAYVCVSGKGSTHPAATSSRKRRGGAR